ncbi:hypothetical protein [Vibrio vulnificus YJ016]|uniref:Uncharacterized protein n=1 Tax=Vibrio vulnificus (strain YJ016) TaxID=196600 RepID=Q7MCM5_VIBVY|nr:hypothetical protein [Vibrio vulnificus YJ016]
MAIINEVYQSSEPDEHTYKAQTRSSKMATEDLYSGLFKDLRAED